MASKVGRVAHVARRILKGERVDGWHIDGGHKGPFATVWTSGIYNIYHDNEVVGRVSISPTGFKSYTVY